MLHGLRVGRPWSDMRERCGKWNSIYVRFPRWAEQGVWNALLQTLVDLGAQDAELEGVALPKDSLLEICLGTANRDPSRRDNPDVYDLHRPAQHHLGFGMGPHQCLGRDVARAEINTGINALLDRFGTAGLLSLRCIPQQSAIRTDRPSYCAIWACRTRRLLPCRCARLSRYRDRAAQPRRRDQP